MRQETYTVIDYKELNTLIQDLFGWPEDYNIVADLCVEDPRWANDTRHAFSIEESKRDNPWYISHGLEDVNECRAEGRIKHSSNVDSIIWLLMRASKIPWGNVLIEVSW